MEEVYPNINYKGVWFFKSIKIQKDNICQAIIYK